MAVLFIIPDFPNPNIHYSFCWIPLFIIHYDYRLRYGVWYENVSNCFRFTAIDVVIYLDFHSAKRALWLVDSWSRVPDQIQMYPDRDTIEQLLSARRTWSVHLKWRDLQPVLTSAWLLNFMSHSKEESFGASNVNVDFYNS